MAITKGAKKAHRASLKKRVYNVRRKVALHDVVKTFKTHLGEGKQKDAEALLPAVYKAIDKAAKGNIITKNTANRKKSRLTVQLRKMQVK